MNNIAVHVWTPRPLFVLRWFHTYHAVNKRKKLLTDDKLMFKKITIVDSF